MNGNEVALDTSAAVKLLNDHTLADRLLRPFSRACLPAIAVGELLYGALNSQRQSINLPRYREFINRCLILHTTAQTAEIYANIRMQLKQDGWPIPESDIWIAASALEHHLPLATHDVHFTHIKGLKTINE